MWLFNSLIRYKFGFSGVWKVLEVSEEERLERGLFFLEQELENIYFTKKKNIYFISFYF